MMHFIVSFLIAIISAVLPWSAYSKDLEVGRADQLIKKYSSIYVKPKSCPLESKKFSDLIAKTEAIKDVLKGNCLKKDNDKMAEVLESIKGIQDELKNQKMITGESTFSNILSESLTSSQNSTNSTGSLSGLKFSAFFSNITTMFKKNQCSMEDGRVLEMTADLIYDSTQLGVLAGNELGLIIAGGGFIISSALRLIDLIFKQRFDFEKPIDRQTFVKLNCSFYEIRRELEVQGALDIENNSSRQDYEDSKKLAEEMTLEIKAMDAELISLTKQHSQIDEKNFEKNVGDLSHLKKVLAKVQIYLQAGINQTLELPSETQKLLMISKLASDYDVLVLQLRNYKSLNLSSIPMLDDLFIQDLKKFDSLDVSSFTETMNISAKEFNDNHRAKILFHLMRISSDINSKEESLSKDNQLAKAERSKELLNKKQAALVKLGEIKKIELRLGNLISPNEYSGLDDGSENLLNILDNHKKISSQLFGEWGDKFLKYATYKSYDEVKLFQERYNLFMSKYSELIKKNDTKKLSSMYLCQDAQKLRLLFKQADNIVQEGYDFIITNKDIIHSDVKNYYNGIINEDDHTASIGPIERVQRHYKSSFLALRELKGLEVSSEEKDFYLTKPFFGSFYIGKSMVDVSQSRVLAKGIQDIYEKFNCQKGTMNELLN